MAQSAMGPFYCPNDREVYLDTSFFRDLERRFRGCSGKACKFAQAYVIAHEVGHHVQNLLGILPQGAAGAARRRATGSQANRIQVRVELQADCFAGVWAHHAEQRWKLLQPGDIEAALQTASAIGDDMLQQRAQGRVVPDSFTHGSSEQRQRWFMTGFKDGTVRACNTFAAARRCKRDNRPGRCPASRDRQFVPLKIAVLTVSDTRELADDKSGATLAERIEKAGPRGRRRAPSSPTTSRRSARSCAPGSPIRRSTSIITTGGTGFTGRDVTPEAVEPLFEKRMDGFSTAFHMVSHAKIGSSTIQSRATAGVANATFIFCLPGSPGACRDAWDEILVHQLDYRYRPCNFVELMPRLDEHLRRPKAKGATV